LVTQLIQWKAIDNDIILLSNFNKNVYTGQIARRLAKDNLNFTEVCQKHTGWPIPPTFRTGSVPIDGIFATAGIECINTFILPHYGGVGNHRCFILDLSSDSLIGTLFPNIVQCAARKLHCSSKQMISTYNAKLTKMCDDHNMFQQMDTIHPLTDYLTMEDFSLLMNSWDDELMQYMLHSEVHVSKFMMGHIEWSPTIGIWLGRRWLLHRVRCWMLGQSSPDPHNMIRDCLKLNISDPQTSTYGTICTQIMVCNLEVKKLSKDAPALRRQHLLDMISSVEDSGDSNRAKEILKILQREAQKKRWKCINQSTCPPRGGAPLAIQVQTSTTVETYDTEKKHI
jgi:hypothetical protein